MIYKPSKLFPCDCMGEGLTVSLYWDDEDMSEGEVKVSEDIWSRQFGEAPYFELSFWEFGVCKKPRWNWWWRLKIAWHMFRKGTSWPDQVILKASVAKNLANHLLYMIGKAQKEMELEKKQEPLVKDGDPVTVDNIKKAAKAAIEPMLCVQHGGSSTCEKSNKEHGFKCPKCVLWNKKWYKRNG